MSLKPGTVLLLLNRLAESAPQIAVVASEKLWSIILGNKEDSIPVLILGESTNKVFSSVSKNGHFLVFPDLDLLISTLPYFRNPLGFYWDSYAEQVHEELKVLRAYLSGINATYHPESSLGRIHEHFHFFL